MQPYPYKISRFSDYQRGLGNPNLAGTDAARRTMYPMARAEPATIALNHCPSVPIRIGIT
jgi:hypothetical protein